MPLLLPACVCPRFALCPKGSLGDLSSFFYSSPRTATSTPSFAEHRGAPSAQPQQPLLGGGIGASEGQAACWVAYPEGGSGLAGYSTPPVTASPALLPCQRPAHACVRARAHMCVCVCVCARAPMTTENERETGRVCISVKNGGKSPLPLTSKSSMGFAIPLPFSPAIISNNFALGTPTLPRPL